MKTLFESISIGPLTLRNRFVRSATFDMGFGRDGHILPAMVNHYRRLALGGSGLIITGMFGVCENSCILPEMVRVYGGSFISEFAPVVKAVHENGGKIAVQLSHTGVKAQFFETAGHPSGPSDYENARAMTQDEIQSVVDAYGEAARKCREAGADAVQIHGAHGYLLSQFLSPYFNHRSDAYGGSIENRSRILREVYASIRKAVGADFPVLLKINYCDLVPGGLTGEDCIWVCRELERMGLDGVEISAGVSLSPESKSAQRGKGEGFNGEYALAVSAALHIPVISVGGYRTVPVMEDYLNRGNIAAISLSRPLVREPDLPRRWQDDPTVKPACVSCNRCFTGSVLECQIAAGAAGPHPCVLP